MKYHNNQGDEVYTEIKPLWEINLKDVDDNYDIVYVPHHENHSFLNDVKFPNTQFLYYMQSPIENVFTVDPQGWAGGMARLVDGSKGSPSAGIYEEFQERIHKNVSKFNQPSKKPLDIKDFVLFVCQLPHDLTIQYHSDVSVEKALTDTIRACKRLSLPLLIKGHPANPGAMVGLKEIRKSLNYGQWTEEHSIHDCISQSKIVVSVNSGTGLETILHGKPQVSFGRSEYMRIINMVGEMQIEDILRDANRFIVDLDSYKSFFDEYISGCIISDKPTTYHRIRGIYEWSKGLEQKDSTEPKKFWQG